MAAAMPPRAWIESERYAQITDAGSARLLTERGVRREILEALDVERSRSASTRSRQAARRARGALGLERDGLVEMTRPLKGAASAYRTVRVATLTAQGHDVVPTMAGPRPALSGGWSGCPRPSARRGARQRRLSLEGRSRRHRYRGPRRSRHRAPRRSNASSELGLVSLSRRRVERDPFDAGRGDDASRAARPLVLTAEQTAGIRAAVRAGGSAVLPDGAAPRRDRQRQDRAVPAARRRPCGARGRGVLMLVPEIALTPAVAAIFRATFGDRVAIQHSGLSDGERHDQWQRIRRGDVDVVVGTRSAVFAPVRSARARSSWTRSTTDPTSRRRARGITAATSPSCAARRPARSSCSDRRRRRSRAFTTRRTAGTTLIALERRVLDRPMAAVRIVDMREEYAASGPDVDPERPLCDALDGPARAARAVDRAAEPPGVRDVGVLPGVRARRSSARTAACR